jgi:hypothetical protein
MLPNGINNLERKVKARLTVAPATSAFYNHVVWEDYNAADFLERKNLLSRDACH